MSDKHDFSATDRLVSETYSDLSRERTPDALDDRVLTMAAREGRTRYAVARGWMRPVAWAATIGLSLAIVLDLTLLPQPDLNSVNKPGTETSAATERDSPVLEETQLPASRPVKEESHAMRQVEPANPVDAPAKRSRPTMNDGRADDDSKAQIESMAEFEPQDMAVVRNAEALARTQAGSDRAQADAPAPGSAAASSLTVIAQSKEHHETRLCAGAVRESAEAWYECLRALRETVPQDRFDAELDELRDRYPEFEVEAADK